MLSIEFQDFLVLNSYLNKFSIYPLKHELKKKQSLIILLTKKRFLQSDSLKSYVHDQPILSYFLRSRIIA